jgi:hypothetical protein
MVLVAELDGLFNGDIHFVLNEERKNNASAHTIRQQKTAPKMLTLEKALVLGWKTWGTV